MLDANQLVSKLARPDLLEIQAYQSARRIGGQGTIWLNANEYPYDSQFNSSSVSVNRYPSAQPDSLINQYAEYAEVQPEQLLVCRGADEGIFLLIQAFCRANHDSIVYCPPTYGMYVTSAQTLAVNSVAVYLTADFQLDLAALEQQLASQPQIKLIFVCNPNNPTGNLIEQRAIKRLLELTAGRCLVVVDEAYIEFSAANSVVSWLPEYTNLVVLRTLSKAFALAGLRCGYVIANAQIIELLGKIIAPYPLATPVIAIAAQALTTAGIAQMRQQVRSCLQNRQLLMASLACCAEVVAILPSAANFLLVKFKDGERIFQLLQQKGIIVRNQTKQYNLPNCLRFTVGSQSECAQLSQALAKL